MFSPGEDITPGKEDWGGGGLDGLEGDFGPDSAGQPLSLSCWLISAFAFP